MILAADCESIDQNTVQTNVEIVRSAHPTDVVVVVSLKADLDVIFTVSREIVADRDTTLRTKWKVLADTLVLDQVQMDIVSLDGGTLGNSSYRSKADAPRCRQVSIHQRGRHRKLAHIVVEALLVGVVHREEVRNVDVETEQVV